MRHKNCNFNNLKQHRKKYSTMLHDIANIEFRGLKKSDQNTQAYKEKGASLRRITSYYSNNFKMNITSSCGVIRRVPTLQVC